MICPVKAATRCGPGAQVRTLALVPGGGVQLRRKVGSDKLGVHTWREGGLADATRRLSDDQATESDPLLIRCRCCMGCLLTRRPSLGRYASRSMPTTPAR